MSSFKILHISDLHLAIGRTLRQTTYAPAILEELARYAYRNRNTFEVILVTGDLADSAWHFDLNLAEDFLHLSPGPHPTPWIHDGRQGKATLQACGKPIFLVPGNHDRFKFPAYGSAGSSNFDDVFTSDWSAGQGGCQRHVIRSDNDTKVTIISADFTLRKNSDANMPFGHFGQGRVYKDTLSDLIQKTKLELTSHPQNAVLWMIHFAPEFDGLDKKLHLIGDNELIKAAADLGICHILCGHTHLVRHYNAENNKGVTVHCAGTAACPPKPGKQHCSIHKYTVKINQGKITDFGVKDLFWDNRQEEFIE